MMLLKKLYICYTVQNKEEKMLRKIENIVRKNINTNKEIMVTNTSCNIVDFATFKEEIIRNNFKIIECYISSDIPNFDKCMCAVISKQE